MNKGFRQILATTTLAVVAIVVSLASMPLRGIDDAPTPASLGAKIFRDTSLSASGQMS